MELLPIKYLVTRLSFISFTLYSGTQCLLQQQRPVHVTLLASKALWTLH